MNLKWLEYIFLFSTMILIVALSFLMLPFSLFLAVLIPLPVLIATYRHSTLLGAIIAVLSTLFFIFFLQDITILILIVAMSTIGIGIGVAMKEKLHYRKILTIGIVSSLITLSLIGLGLSVATKQSLPELFEGTTNQMLEDLLEREIPEAQLPIEQIENTIETVRMLYPSILFTGAVLLAGINFLVATKVLTRLKMTDVPSLPKVSDWIFPTWLSFAFFILWILSKFDIFPHLLAVVLANLLNVVTWFLVIQGICIVLYFMDSARMPIFVRVLILFPLWLFGGWFLSFLGALDPWLKYRGRLRIYRSQLKKDSQDNRKDQEE